MGAYERALTQSKCTQSRKDFHDNGEHIGASVAQWSERSPFTSETAGSILRENFLNVTRTSAQLCEKS